MPEHRNKVAETSDLAEKETKGKYFFYESYVVIKSVRFSY